MTKKIKTRIAPSPTGFMHIGNLRTALYNYLFAKQNKGEFLLRIEDTDRERFVKDATEKTMEVLKWAGLQWDGKPVVQSKRLEIYQKYAQQLVDENKAYYCFCTPQGLEKMRAEQIRKKQPPRYDGRCKKLSEEEIKEKLERNLPSVIRLNTQRSNSRQISFKDIVYGEIKVEIKEIDDQVLLKSDGYPTYHLAVVVDDHEMGVTHVLRGEDWLPSTPKHVLLYQAFGWKLPVFCHLPNILGAGRKKLSKRDGGVTVEDFQQQGYLSEALLNYLALLGWNPGTEQEIFSLPELLKQFDLKKIHKAGAIFDAKKLAHINGHYIRQLSVNQLISLCVPYLEEEYNLKKYDNKYVEKVIKIEQERLKKLEEIKENAKLFFVDKLDYKVNLLLWKKCTPKEIKRNLEKLSSFAKAMEDKKGWNKDNLEKEIFAFIKSANLTNGEVLWPLRVALSGQQNSPGPFEIAEILGKKESLKRIQGAVDKLVA